LDGAQTILSHDFSRSVFGAALALAESFIPGKQIKMHCMAKMLRLFHFLLFLDPEQKFSF